MLKNSQVKNVDGENIDAFVKIHRQSVLGVLRISVVLSLSLSLALLLPSRGAFLRYTDVTGKLGHVRRDKRRFTESTRARCPRGNLSYTRRCQLAGSFRKWKRAETNSRSANIIRLRKFFLSDSPLTHPRANDRDLDELRGDASIVIGSNCVDGELPTVFIRFPRDRRDMRG